MKVKVLLLPHFEIGEMTGDFPGEAQMFFEEYLTDSEKFTTPCMTEIYYNKSNGIALSLTGSGKVNTAICLTSILSDTRFDFSDAYIFSFGCAGGAAGVSVLGDVIIETAVCDHDLGHTADIREMTDKTRDSCWFYDSSYDGADCIKLDSELCDMVFRLTADTVLETTEISKRTYAKNFSGEDWIKREPHVIKGTAVTGDNFWKGKYDHIKATEIVKKHSCPDCYAVSEMEDIACACIAKRFGKLDRLIIMRVNVNPDVFINGNTPESLWGNDFNFNTAVKKDNNETLDIFLPAMRNSFKVGSKIINLLLLKNGETENEKK